MKKRWFSISLAVCAYAFLALLLSSVSAAPIAAKGLSSKSELAYAQQPLVDWEYDQINPSAAFSAQSGLFLVAWEDHHWGWGADWDIYGRMVNTAGNPVGTYFGIAWENANHRLRPDVAYNSTNGEFLVVYEYEQSVTNHDILARRVSSSGELLGGEFIIANQNPNNVEKDETHPVITYNPIDDQYLVVYQRWEGDIEFGNNDLYGRRLAGDGTPQGNPMAIKVSPENESAPTAAFIPALHQYLVMWSDSVELYPRLKKQWVNPNGTLGNYEQYFTVGANYQPRLAASTHSLEYVYVYEDKVYGPPERIIGYVELHNESGGFGSPIVWDDQKDETNIDLAYNPQADNYVIVWESAYSPSDHDVYMLLYDSYTPNFCCLSLGPKVVSNLTSWEGNPTAASSTGAVSLIVWEDNRTAGNGLDIYSTVVYHGKIWLPIVKK